MSSLASLKSHLRRGQVYRRADLARWSNAVDRHLKQLLADGTLRKISPGMYYYPARTAFGEAPADENNLVKAFLKDDRFLMLHPNLYNSLGVGTTQLYNTRVVYNHKRHGHFKLGNRQFSFQVKPHFPRSITAEFLLVDLVNNLDQLAEDAASVLEAVYQKMKTLDAGKLSKALAAYGSMKTKRRLAPAMQKTAPEA